MRNCKRKIWKREHYIYFEHLTDSVYLNINAIAYDLSNDKWNDFGYGKAMESNILDLVLAENPEM